MKRAALLALSMLAWAASFLFLRFTGSWLVFVIAGGAVAALWLAIDEQSRKLMRWDASAVAAGLAAGVVQVVATYALWPVTRSWIPASVADVNALYEVMQGWSPPVVLRATLLAFVGACEEVAFRGSTLTATESRARSWETAGRVVLMAGLYAAAQATSANAVLIVVAFVLGVYWGTVRVLSGSLVSAAIAHAMWDVAVMVIHPLN